MKRPSFYNYAHREANIRQAETNMWNTPMGQTLNSGINFLNVLATWIMGAGSKIGLKFEHADGTLYSWADFEELVGSHSGNGAPAKPFWDRPTWDTAPAAAGARATGPAASTPTGMEFGRRHETLAPGETYVTPSTIPDAATRAQISRVEIKGDLRIYHGTMGGKSFTIEKSAKESVAFADNNPGNIMFSTDIADDFHAIGADPDGRAIFADAATGILAQVTMLRDIYNGMTLEQVINEHFYADPAIVDRITKAAGIAKGTDIDNLTPAQLGKFSRQVANVEGWAPGNVIFRNGGALTEQARNTVLADQGVTPDLQKSRLQATWDGAVVPPPLAAAVPAPGPQGQGADPNGPRAPTQ